MPGRASRALLIGALFFALAPASGLRDAPAPLHAVHLHHRHVEITGGSDVDTPRVERALERVLATRVGLRAASLIDSGALGHPLHIELNAHGDNHTIYRVPGVELSETILFDPFSFPLVETQDGPRAAPPETVLAHELGHAVFKLASEDEVIQQIENPIREELGLPLRLHF
ncbi:MAG TPA: hypothetical protein VMS55_03980 [Myxococcota bacterium]|nr:hypothetical protein [Myxococcota bacterium]